MLRHALILALVVAAGPLAAEEPPAADECVAREGKACVLASGVRYVELRAGKGEQPHAGARVTVHYTGRFASTGKVFDSSRGKKPWSWTWGKPGQVIAGYELGLASARVGARRQITIPPEHAYGKQGYKKIIPPDSTLVFDVELLSVQEAP